MLTQQDASIRPLRRDAFDYWKAKHLLNRAGFGGTPSQIQALADMGLDRAVDYIVDYESIAFDEVRSDLFDHNIMRPATPEERQVLAQARREQNEAIVERFQIERQRRQAADRTQLNELRRWWIRRLIRSPRPLEEKMTLFWHGHFATNYRGIEDSYHMFMQNQLFRANATGSFARLAFGIIRDPAMLRYLNNDQNRAQAPNENLARELMELFVLGEGNEYTEQDIKEGARALTGYTFDDDSFVFRPALHDAGPKRILGQTGTFNGDDFVRIILSRRVTSEFIALKLFRFFVNDLPGTPPRPVQQYILQLARTIRSSNYELKPMLKQMFKSEYFYSEENLASMIKSPTQLVIQAIRSLYTPARDLGVLTSALDLMGQNLFQPPSVKGWDGGRSWINTSTLFVRQNTMIYLLTGRRPNMQDWQVNSERYDAMHLVSHLRNGSEEIPGEDAVKYLLRFTLGREPEPARVGTLTRFVSEHGGRIDNDMVIAILSLITAMPEYQLC